MDFNALLQEEGIEAPEPAMTGELVVFYSRELVKVQTDLEVYRKELKEMEAQAKILVVKDEASAMTAVEYGSQSQGLIKKIKVKMEAIIQEPNEFVGKVRNIVKSLTEPLENIKIEVGTKRDTWIAAERKRKAELQAKAEKEARELQDRLNREAHEKAEAEARVMAELEAEKRGIPVEEVEVVVPIIEEVIIFTPVVEQPQATVRAESGSGTAFQREGKWAGKVKEPFEENIVKVPAKYLMLNMVEVNKAIKAGIREIEGLEIKQEEKKTSFRSR